MDKSYRSKNLTRASPEGSARSSCRRQREAGGTARGREARNKRHRAMRSKDKGREDRASLQLFLGQNVKYKLFAYQTEGTLKTYNQNVCLH